MPTEATVAKFRPYTPDEIEAISEQLYSAYGDVQGRLLKTMARGDITSWRKAFTSQQLAQVERMLDDLNATTAFWTETHVPDLYKRGLWTADGYLQPGGLSKIAHPGEWTPMDLGMARMHDEAVRLLAENVALPLQEANSYCAQRIGDMVARAQKMAELAGKGRTIPAGLTELDYLRDTAEGQVQLRIRDASLRSMQQAFAQGMTRQEASRAFVGELQRRGVPCFIDRAGREWNMETYSSMVSRTVAHEAQRHGLQNRMVEIGEDLVEVIPHTRFKDSCDEYEGKLLSITGKSVGQTVGGRKVVASVDHARATSHLFGPNCTHSAVPYIVD
jgi:hypothetical protein